MKLLYPLVIMWIFGCSGSPTPQTFTVRASPQLEAQADLATTTHAVARKVESSGTEAHSQDSSFLVDATGVWKNQVGPGKQLDPTPATVAREEQKIAEAKAKAERDAEAERAAHVAQVNELNERLKMQGEKSAKAIADLQAALDKLKSDRATAEMWAKLWAILLVGGAAAGASYWFALTRKLTPLVAISFAALAGVVVVRACAGDITIVLILAVVLAALYALGMWAWEHRKFLTADKVASVQETAIENLPADVAPVVKAAVRTVAGDAGVQPALSARLVEKGFSGTK